MANVYAKITTGKNVSPHILKSVTNQGEVIYEVDNDIKKLELKETTIIQVNKMLANNVNPNAMYTFVEGYDVGGTTGTAQKYGGNGQIANGKYISSYIGTFPARNPKYVLIVCVDEPSNGAYYGGVVAKPIGQEVYTQIFKIKSILPNNSDHLDLMPNIKMPSLVGLPLAEAFAELKKLGLDAICDQDGEIVVAQYPKAGTMLYLGEITHLIVN